MKNKITIFLTLMLVLVVQLGFAQEKVITGVVTEAGTGDPIPGANVILKGTNKGAATDFDGKYTIKANKGDVLVFSAVGYKNAERRIGDANKINVVLKEENNQLEAVVINALGIEVKKSSEKGITVSNVKAKTLQTSGESDPVAALAGKVSGVNINLASGDPGASANITIRGPKSILGSNKPLFVVDGVVVNSDIYGSGVAGVERPSKISDIDPNNIKSVKILKGGAAAAIWGARGANGVVIITTKSGTGSKDGSVGVSYTNTLSFDNPLTKYPLQDVFGQGTDGNYVYPGTAHSQSGSWGDKIDDRSGSEDMLVDPTLNDFYFLDQDGKKWGMIFQKNQKDHFNQKNYDAVIGQGSSVRNSVQMSVNTKKAKYLLGFNNLNQNGIFKNSSYSKVGVNFNSTFTPIKKVKVVSNFTFVNSKQNAIQKGSNLSGLLLGLYRTPTDFDNSGYVGERHSGGNVVYFSHRSYREPIGTDKADNPPYYGSPGYNNPLFTIYEQKNPYKSNHFIGGTRLSYSFTDWFKMTAKSGIDYALERAATYYPVYSGNDPEGAYSSYMWAHRVIDTDLIGQISKEVSKDINMDLLLGFNWRSSNTQQISASYRHFLLPTDIPNSSNSTSENNGGGFYTSTVRKNSGYGSATFSYKDLMFLTLTGRGDRASSYYGFIFYPSVSFAFDVANLKYFKDNDNINQITLHANWSKVGKEPSPYGLRTDYVPAGGGDSYASYWSAGNYNGSILRSIVVGNPDIKPEITKELEFGSEFMLLKNRLKFNFTYYNSVSSDLLLYVKLPAATGYNYTMANVAEMTNKGIEIESSYKIFDKQKWNWSLGATYSQNKNEVTRLVSTDYFGFDGFVSTSSGAAQGYAFGILRSGDFERDADGNLVLDSNGFPQKGEKIFAGDPNADFKASVFTDFNYKNFKLRILADGSFGGQSWDGTTGALTFFGRTLETANEVTVSASEANDIVNSRGESIASLTTPNSDGSYTIRGNIEDFGGGKVLLDQSWYTGTGGGFGPVGTQFFKDATWMKLREVTLGYTLRADILKKAKIKSVYFGITGRNLYLWTKDKSWHIDPESNLSGSSKGRGLQYFNHPTTKSFVFTTSIKF